MGYVRNLTEVLQYHRGKRSNRKLLVDKKEPEDTIEAWERDPAEGRKEGRCRGGDRAEREAAVGKGIAEGLGGGWRGARERVGRWPEKAVTAGESDNEDTRVGHAVRPQ